MRSIALLAAVADFASAQAAPVRAAASAFVRVSIQVDTTSAQFNAEGFELKVSPTGLPGVNAEIQLVKQAGAYTGLLMGLSGRREHASGATIEVLDSTGAPDMTFRLTDVTIVSHRLALASNRASLEQQSISQQEALSPLNAEYQEATRQLATTDELAKRNMATRLELARARDRVSDLQRRVDLLKLRQVQVARQLGGNGLEETLVLHFGHLEVERKDSGGRAMVDIVVRGR